MVHKYQIDGLPIQTGDIICTMNGKPDILPGEFWRLVGRLVPGDVDHIAIYLGPDGRCIEAGGLGVVTFEVNNGYWNPELMMQQRGQLIDRFYGVASPLAALDLDEGELLRRRTAVADYCLAQLGKSYNLNFLDPDRDDAFYCSQLAYKAYLQVGINLNTGLSIDDLAGTEQIIFPQEIWSGCRHAQLALLQPAEIA